MARAEATIANYDAQTAEEIRQRLRTLSQSDLAKLEAHEKQGQARSTILDRIAALRGDAPWSGYDDMEVEEINAALKQRDGDAVRRVLDYERRHKDRTTIIDFATRMQEASEGSSASTPTQTRRAGKTNGSQARTRSQPSKSTARSKRSTSKATTAASQKASTGKSTKPSRPARPRKAAASTTRAKTTSSPTSARGSRGSQQGKRSGGSSRPRSQSSPASRPATQSRAPSTAQSSQSELDASDIVQAASARIAQRVTEALQGAEQRTKKLAKEAEHAVGAAAQDSRHAVGAAVKDTGEAAAEGAKSGARSAKRKRDGSATQGGGSSAARSDAAQNSPDLAATAKVAVSNVTELAVRFKGPAIAIAAATGGALALKGRKRRNRRQTVLGITLPRSSELDIQSVAKTLGRASKQFGKTSKGLCKDIERVGDQAERIGKILD